MKLPAGNPIERGKTLKELNAEEHLKKLSEEQFTGYLCVTIHGKKGIEEGILLYHKGKIVASSYEYFYYDRTFKAEEALKRTLNALKANFGVVDYFSLSPSQVQLALTLNDEFNLEKALEFEEINLPKVFSQEFEEKIAEEQGELSKEEFFKKLGLQKAGKKATYAQIVEKAKKEAEPIEIEEKPSDKEAERLSKLKKLLKK